ncbi:MAG: ferritin-like domain-containing protein [Sphingobacteriales bacterium JAD_PAG50586_3]|nr:MAG: ferritin-like domain-containing protein [Sphingobacteriales bacterium JAD_PAG50586_3]
MKMLNILEKLGDTKFDFSQTNTRRESIFSIGQSGKAILTAALPLGVIAATGASAKANTTSVAGAASTATVIDVLNFALTLEYLEAQFYNMGVTSGVIANADLAVFNQIRQHENDHVTFLTNTIESLNGTPVNSPIFDFTAGGAFQPFVLYGDFLALAQAFEDTGVRAYKGQAGNLIGSDAILTAALQIHSVEARHASEVRRLRTKNGLDTSKGWITGNSRGTLPAPTQAVYDGEQNLSQGGITNITSITTVSAAGCQEAFDEPLTDTQVLAIANLFIV